jgi:hypothetical protein
MIVPVLYAEAARPGAAVYWAGAHDPRSEAMADGGMTRAFAQPVAELTLREREGGEHTLRLRLMETTLALVAGPETEAHIRGRVAAGEAGLEGATRLLRRLVGRMLQAPEWAQDAAFRPHPLRETDVRLGGPNLHVRIGAFDEEYEAGEFDPAEAETFVARYTAARAAAGV